MIVYSSDCWGGDEYSPNNSVFQEGTKLNHLRRNMHMMRYIKDAEGKVRPFLFDRPQLTKNR
jgi:hypothetical protein